MVLTDLKTTYSPTIILVYIHPIRLLELRYFCCIELWEIKFFPFIIWQMKSSVCFLCNSFLEGKERMIALKSTDSFFFGCRVTSNEVARSVDKLLPELLTKSGDTSQRINQMAVHTILTMADCKNVRWVDVIELFVALICSSLVRNLFWSFDSIISKILKEVLHPICSLSLIMM